MESNNHKELLSRESPFFRYPAQILDHDERLGQKLDSRQPPTLGARSAPGLTGPAGHLRPLLARRDSQVACNESDNEPSIHVLSRLVQSIGTSSSMSSGYKSDPKARESGTSMKALLPAGPELTQMSQAQLSSSLSQQTTERPVVKKEALEQPHLTAKELQLHQLYQSQQRERDRNQLLKAQAQKDIELQLAKARQELELQRQENAALERDLRQRRDEFQQQEAILQRLLKQQVGAKESHQSVLNHKTSQTGEYKADSEEVGAPDESPPVRCVKEQNAVRNQPDESGKFRRRILQANSDSPSSYKSLVKSKVASPDELLMLKQSKQPIEEESSESGLEEQQLTQQLAMHKLEALRRQMDQSAIDASRLPQSDLAGILIRKQQIKPAARESVGSFCQPSQRHSNLHELSGSCSRSARRTVEIRDAFKNQSSLVQPTDTASLSQNVRSEEKLSDVESELEGGPDSDQRYRQCDTGDGGSGSRLQRQRELLYSSLKKQTAVNGAAQAKLRLQRHLQTQLLLQSGHSLKPRPKSCERIAPRSQRLYSSPLLSSSSNGMFSLEQLLEKQRAESDTPDYSVRNAMEIDASFSSSDNDSDHENDATVKSKQRTKKPAQRRVEDDKVLPLQPSEEDDIKSAADPSSKRPDRRNSKVDEAKNGKLPVEPMDDPAGRADATNPAGLRRKSEGPAKVPDLGKANSKAGFKDGAPEKRPSASKEAAANLPEEWSGLPPAAKNPSRSDDNLEESDAGRGRGPIPNAKQTRPKRAVDWDSDDDPEGEEAKRQKRRPKRRASKLSQMSLMSKDAQSRKADDDEDDDETEYSRPNPDADAGKFAKRRNSVPDPASKSPISAAAAGGGENSDSRFQSSDSKTAQPGTDSDSNKADSHMPTRTDDSEVRPALKEEGLNESMKLGIVAEQTELQQPVKEEPLPQTPAGPRHSWRSKHNKTAPDSYTQDSEHRGMFDDTRETDSDTRSSVPNQGSYALRPDSGSKVQLLARKFFQHKDQQQAKQPQKEEDRNSSMMRSVSDAGKQGANKPKDDRPVLRIGVDKVPGNRKKSVDRSLSRVAATEGAPLQVKPEDSLSQEDIEACKTRAQKKNEERRKRRETKLGSTAVPIGEVEDDDDEVAPVSQQETTNEQALAPVRKSVKEPYDTGPVTGDTVPEDEGVMALERRTVQEQQAAKPVAPPPPAKRREEAAVAPLTVARPPRRRRRRRSSRLEAKLGRSMSLPAQPTIIYCCLPPPCPPPPCPPPPPMNCCSMRYSAPLCLPPTAGYCSIGYRRC